MRIGLDFDGVISDCGQLKSDGAKLLYGIEIPPEKFKKELVVDKGILTLEQYRHLQKQIYGTREIGLTMLPVNGVLELVPKLQQEGYDLMIVTSRGEPESEIAREWMELKGLELHLVGVGGGVVEGSAKVTLEWTEKTPTIEGHYWLHQNGRIDVVRMQILSFGCYVQWPGTGDGWNISRAPEYHGKCLWYGPLVPPAMENRD